MLNILYTIYYLWNKGPTYSPDSLNNNYSVVYIHGAGHCGSTLLNLLLNAHPKVIGLSEVSNLHKTLLDGAVNSDNLKLANTKFWSSVFKNFESITGTPLLSEEYRFSILDWQEYFSLNRDEIEYYQEVNEIFFDVVQKQGPYRVICDASKFLQRAHLLLSSGTPIKVIHLDRDGLGVANSYLRKGRTMTDALQRWGMAESGKLLLSHWLPNKSLLFCKYEKLAKDPKKELHRICDFLDIEFSDEMITDFRKTDNFGISGNRMRHSTDPRIYLDNSWKKNMPTKDKYEFWVKGGWLSWPIDIT